MASRSRGSKWRRRRRLRRSPCGIDSAAGQVSLNADVLLRLRCLCLRLPVCVNRNRFVVRPVSGELQTPAATAVRCVGLNVKPKISARWTLGDHPTVPRTLTRNSLFPLFYALISYRETAQKWVVKVFLNPLPLRLLVRPFTPKDSKGEGRVRGFLLASQAFIFALRIDCRNVARPDPAADLSGIAGPTR